MKLLDPKKLRKLVPVKLIGNHFVKIQDENLEQKEPKRPKSSSKTLETSYSTLSHNSTISNIHINHTNNNSKLIRNLSQKYIKLVEDLKDGKEIIGTVEEKKNDFPTRNPFSFKTNLNHHNFISKTKTVLFKKQEQNVHVLKILDKSLYMTIYNKTQPPKREYNKNELLKIIKLQKRFKGFAVREVEQKVRNLKVNKCLLEVLCIIACRAFDNAKKRIMYQMIKNVYYHPFKINDEIYFKDKLDFKLPDKYYNMETIQKIDLASKKKFIVKKKKLLINKNSNNNN